jgi:asparagine synthetase B (glutamine-hydrolysing)
VRVREGTHVSEDPDAPNVVDLNIGVIRGLAGEALDALDPLEDIQERLLDLADPRVTPGTPDHVREQLRDVAGEISIVHDAIGLALRGIDSTIVAALMGDEDDA